MRIDRWNIHSLSPEEKICTMQEIPDILANLKCFLPTLVPGVFDGPFPHPGHLYFIEEAARRSRVIVVGVEPDEAVTLNKGPNRPLFSAEARMQMLSHIGLVNLVFTFEDTPHYSDPNAFDAYVNRYKQLGIMSIAVLDSDPNWEAKIEQALAADIMVSRIGGHLPYSTTQSLRQLGYEE
ncbi:MAG TPA: adenylyltransferase/cytidyltransferase family protein [Candidatus Saccharimonadales bacterium]